MGASEFELIERVKAALGSQEGLPVGPGDDAAVLGIGGRPVVSVDSMVEGVHFPAGWTDSGDIAHRALAGALSDLAAMASDPRTVLVAMGLPPGREPVFLEGLADSTVEAARRFGVSLAGGDVVSSPVLFISVTVIGDLPEGAVPVTRSGARPGELVAVTGNLGGSAAGLRLAGGERFEGLAAEVQETLLTRYLRPEPRCAMGSALRDVGPTAMVDVSDGLVADLGHLAEASGVAISIDADAVPVAPGVEAVADALGRNAFELALAGGEDYELAMTIRQEDLGVLEDLAGQQGIPVTIIGRTGEGSGIEATSAGEPVRLPPGFEHSF